MNLLRSLLAGWPRPPYSLRVRWRFYMILGLNLLVLVIVLGASLIMVLEQRQSLARLHETATYQVRAAIEHQENIDVQTLAVAGQSLDPAASSEAGLNSLLALLPGMESISLVTADGVEAARAPDGLSRQPVPSWDTQPAWIAATAGEVFTGLVEIEGTAPRYMVAVPVGNDGSVLVASADPQVCWDEIVAGAVGDEGYVYLVSTAGTLLVVPPDQDRQDLHDPGDFSVFERARAGDPSSGFYHGLEGGWVVGRAEHIPGTALVVMIETPRHELVPLIVRSVALWMMALLLTFLIGEWLVRRIASVVLKPLDILQQGAQAVGAGDYTFWMRMPADTDRELVDLSGAFNDMTVRLKAGQEQIDAYTNEIETIVDLRARELSRKALQLEVAAQVSSKIATILDPKALIVEVVNLIKNRFDLYHVDILTFDADGRILESGTMRYADGTPRTISALDHGISVIAWVARYGQTRYVPDVSEEPRYRRLQETPASRCELAIPLRFGDRIIGVLNLEADHRDAFRPDEVAVFESLANEIAVSMHNAEMFAALETANRDLAQATMQAKQASVVKSRFMLNASHKLRTPLNAIIGYSETILSGIYGEIPETALDRQRRILENGRHLHALIEDMLDLASIESGYVELNLQWIETRALLDEVMNASRALLQTVYPKQDLTLRLDAPQRLPPLWVDVHRMRYILINLMSNAVKFTDQGDIVMAVEVDEGGGLLYIHVQDTGIGIPEEDLIHLFKPFQHHRGSTGDEGKGTGLGLPVSRMLALLHGGDLMVSSTPGQGSTFTLSLPLRPEGAPPSPN